MSRDTREDLALIDRMQRELFPDLENNFGFHPGFIYRIQAFYLLHLIKIKSFKLPPLSGSPKSDVMKVARSFLRSLKLRRNLVNEKTDVLLVGYKAHEYPVNGLKTNIYIEPVKKKLESLGYSVRIFYFDAPSPNKHGDEFYQYYKAQRTIFRFFLKRKSSQLNKNRNRLNDWLASQKISESNDISEAISQTVVQNAVAYEVWNKLCDVIRPRLIWSYCFYDNETSALTRVANERKIYTIDYQHSQQSTQHFAYVQWVGIDRFREFFPSAFWAWRLSDKKRIEQDLQGAHYVPNVISGGNIWLSEQITQLAEHSPGRSVLVTLQGIWIPDYLEDFIKNDREYKWYFRLHPRYPQDQPKLMELHGKFPDRIDYLEANSLSLYSIFSKVSLHITQYSGTALEADAFGIKNIILGEDGYRTYNSYIDEGSFSYANSKESLLEAIAQKNAQKSNDPVLVDKANIDRNLRKLLNEVI